MTKLCKVFVGCLLLIVTGCTRPTHESVQADLLLTNARVYTLSWGDPAADGMLAGDAPHDAYGWNPDASAVAVAGGSIVFVGGAQEAARHVGLDTRVIDLKGATVLPGLVDSHTHVFNLGAGMHRVNLIGVATEEQAVALIVERARTVPKGQWIVGQGWDEGAWANHYPDKTLLTRAVPHHPVFMRSLHSFAGWGNQLALDRAGINASTRVPSGGEMRIGADGQPNGLLLNRAVTLLENAIDAPSRAMVTRQALDGLTQMAKDGYTTVHDAGLDATQMDVLEQLEQDGRLPVRVYALLSIRDEALVRSWLERGPDTDADSMLVTRAVKAYFDGALGSRGARLLEDYSDTPGHRGVSGDEYGFDEVLAQMLMKAGFQIGIHAIGDAGNRATLDFLERVAAAGPGADTGRHRIEHAQVISAPDSPRLAALNVIASMQPPHAVEDKAWAQQRLGAGRIRGAYAWRTLRNNGARIIFNADNPGSDHNIFYGLHAGVTRRDKDRQPTEGWYADQALNMDEAVRAYTRWAAYAAFREDQTGVIAPGRWADLTVMDIDPFVLSTTDPGAILGGKILMTVVDGKIVYAQN